MEGPTRRSSEPEPADWLRDKSNVISGWLPSLTFALDGVRDATAETVMNNSQPSQVSRPWLWWSVACLVLLSAVVMLSRTGRLPRRATVTIDTKGTARLGGVFPLQNKTVRDVALTAAGYLNGGTASIVAAESTSFSNLVETIGAMHKAGITSVTLRTESSAQQRPEQKPR